jgi:hypothetical protein
LPQTVLNMPMVPFESWSQELQNEYQVPMLRGFDELLVFFIIFIFTLW